MSIVIKLRQVSISAVYAWIRPLYVLLFCFYCAILPANERPGGPVNQPIVYKVLHIARIGGLLRKEPNAIAGLAWHDYSTKVIAETSEIPLLLGHGFGVLFFLGAGGDEMDTVRLVVQGPLGEQFPTERTLRVDRVQRVADTDSGRVVSFSYFFDQDWELREGTWKVEIWHGPVMLGAVDVHTRLVGREVLPDAVPQ
jgi:hypothetical protein